jgi:hypothetical protein
MKKFTFVVISFMISLLLAIKVIVGAIVAVIGDITTANNMLAYAAVSSTNSSTTITSQSFSLHNTETKKVRVGDIDIAYKIFGKGKPLILTPGFSMTMDMWDPNMLNKLSSNHTVVIFDNRGIGHTTAGNNTKQFSIPQFVNDTAGLLAALKLDGNNNQPVDILL